jgi:hypothetical protein
MIECIELNSVHHESLKTQVYLYRDNNFTRVRRYDFHKTEHPHLKISETEDGIWLSPLSTHPPEIWNNAGGYEQVHTMYQPDTLKIRQTSRPVHLYFYVLKSQLDTFYNNDKIYFRPFDPAPNCQLIYPSYKPPKKSPPKALVEI